MTSLSDFLGTGAGLYTSYLDYKNTGNSAKASEAQAQLQALKVEEAKVRNEAIKKYAIWGFAAVAGILVLVFVFKKLK